MAIEARRIQTSRAQWAESQPILRGLGIFLLAAGCVLLVGSLYSATQKYRRIKQWVPIDALVLQLQFVSEPRQHGATNYRPHLTLQYQVAGKTLVSSAQSDYTTSTSSDLLTWNVDYRPGRTQQIRYNPERPQEITLDNLNFRSFRQPLWLGGWGTGILLLGLLLRRS